MQNIMVVVGNGRWGKILKMKVQGKNDKIGWEKEKIAIKSG